MIIRGVLVSLTLFFFVNTTFAQEEKEEKKDCYLCDQHQYTNPYQFGIKSEWPFYAVSAGMVATGLILRNNNSLQPFTVNELELLDRNDVNAFDRGATYNWDENAKKQSDILILSAFVLPAVFLINHHTREDIGALLLMGLEIASINFGITASVKNLVNRTRPYVYNTELSTDIRTNSQGRLSFFSGHTSTTASFSFFFAKVMSDYHPNMKTGWKIGMWTFAAAVPAATGYLRVKAGYHFRTDVLTGYAVGAAIGWLIPHLHKRKNANANLSIFPTRVFDSSGLGLTYKF